MLLCRQEKTSSVFWFGAKTVQVFPIWLKKAESDCFDMASMERFYESVLFLGTFKFPLHLLLSSSSLPTQFSSNLELTCALLLDPSIITVIAPALGPSISLSLSFDFLSFPA